MLEVANGNSFKALIAQKFIFALPCYLSKVQLSEVSTLAEKFYDSTWAEVIWRCNMDTYSKRSPVKIRSQRILKRSLDFLVLILFKIIEMKWWIGSFDSINITRHIGKEKAISITLRL